MWIGLAALALQIGLAPVFSGRALAMALDPLADTQICATGPDSRPMPTNHSGHCGECCLIHCAVDTAPVLPPVLLDFLLPSRDAVQPAIAYVRPLTRGPPSRALPATGPPSLLV